MKNCVEVIPFVVKKISVECSTLLICILQETGSILNSGFTVPTETISPCLSPSREMVGHILSTTKPKVHIYNLKNEVPNLQAYSD
jgi:hypothetical protein